MSDSEWLLIGTCALGLYGAGTGLARAAFEAIGSWTYVGANEFRAYHAAWWRSIWGVVLAPAAALIVGSALMVWRRAPGVPEWAPWLGFVLQAALLVGTAAWWGPLMARLEAPDGGLRLERYRLLMTTHWLRVAIVTAYAALALSCWPKARGETSDERPYLFAAVRIGPGPFACAIAASARPCLRTGYDRGRDQRRMVWTGLPFGRWRR